MRTIGDAIWPHQIAPLLRQIQNLGEVHLVGSVYTDAEWELGIEQCIAATRMNQNRAWGSEVEVMALAHLLDTPIYSYDTVSGWNLYIPGMVHLISVIQIHIKWLCMCTMLLTTMMWSIQCSNWLNLAKFNSGHIKCIAHRLCNYCLSCCKAGIVFMVVV